jgi:hypothetical protein
MAAYLKVAAYDITDNSGHTAKGFTYVQHLSTKLP